MKVPETYPDTDMGASVFELIPMLAGAMPGGRLPATALTQIVHRYITAI
jgi:hypothetical protein